MATSTTRQGAQQQPTRAGRYALIEPIGRGGMGVVYRARDDRLGRDVAVKLLATSRLDDAGRERFRRAAKLAATLDHVNIARVHDSGSDEQGVPFLVMDLIDGTPLDDLALSPAEAARIALQAARGLAHAHGRGVLHRDVKPSNILVEPAGRVVLLDFGLARLEGEGEGMTTAGAFLGTPAYMSPEQAFEPSDALDARTDVYGLGATLYQALTGAPPYAGPTALAVLRQVEQEDPPPPSSRRPGVPAVLDRICLRAMARRRESRYPDATALASALEDALGAGLAAPAERRPWLVPALAGALCMLCLGALVRALTPDAETPTPATRPEAQKRVLDWPTMRASAEKLDREARIDLLDDEAEPRSARFALERAAVFWAEGRYSEGLEMARASRELDGDEEDRERGRTAVVDLLLASPQVWLALIAPGLQLGWHEDHLPNGRDPNGWTVGIVEDLRRGRTDVARGKLQVATGLKIEPANLLRLQAWLAWWDLGREPDEASYKLRAARLVGRFEERPEPWARAWEACLRTAMGDQQSKIDRAIQRLERDAPDSPSIPLVQAVTALRRGALEEAVTVLDEHADLANAVPGVAEMRALVEVLAPENGPLAKPRASLTRRLAPYAAEDQGDVASALLRAVHHALAGDRTKTHQALADLHERRAGMPLELDLPLSNLINANSDSKREILAAIRDVQLWQGLYDRSRLTCATLHAELLDDEDDVTWMETELALVTADALDGKLAAAARRLTTLRDDRGLDIGQVENAALSPVYARWFDIGRLREIIERD